MSMGANRNAFVAVYRMSPAHVPESRGCKSATTDLNTYHVDSSSSQVTILVMTFFFMTRLHISITFLS